MRRLRPEFWRQKNWLLQSLSPTHPAFLEGRQCDAINVIETESQGVLSTLAEHDTF
jgi:hypothetical protein